MQLGQTNRTKRILLRRLKESWQWWLLLLPAFVYVCIFCYGPMYGLQIAFRNYRPRQGITGSAWVGLEHFIRFFNYPNFWKMLRNTLTITLYSLATFPCAILFALMLNEVYQVKLKKSMQMITYRNNGTDICMDECIALAREALAEFPGNPRLMASLASVLYTAGYVRHGEHHVTDAEGYSVYDTARHRRYAEWKEAVALYEKALPALESDDLRHDAVDELSQLYLNLGEHDKALTLAEAAPDIWGSRDFLRICAYDGRQQAQACGEALLKTARACAALMVQCVLTFGFHMTPVEKAQSVVGAIRLFDAVCPDGNAGHHHAYMAKMSMLLSVCLWLDH